MQVNLTQNHKIVSKIPSKIDYKNPYFFFNLAPSLNWAL